MKQINTEGIILNRINYQDADRILTVLSNNFGKLQIIAKGVRKAQSKLAGSLELFSTIELSYIPSKGEINTLIGARLIKHYGNIVRSLDKTELAYQLMKLINFNVDGDSEEGVYELLVLVLKSLNDDLIPIELVRFWFYLNFLNKMGHVPNLEVSDSANNDESSYRFDLNKMKFIIDQTGSYNANLIKLFRISLVNQPDKLYRIQNLDQVLPSANSLVEKILLTNGYRI